jgi:hypothetical protein
MALGRVSLAVAALASVFPQVNSTEPRVRPGEWELTIQSDQDPQQIDKICLEQAAAEKLSGTASAIRSYFEEEASKSACAVEEFQFDANVEKHVTRCGSRLTRITTTFGSNAFTTEMSFADPQGATHTTRVTARRIGDCASK